jgi:hypothetical protein
MAELSAAISGVAGGGVFCGAGTRRLGVVGRDGTDEGTFREMFRVEDGRGASARMPQRPPGCRLRRHW